jgi:nitrogen-specific signal transduction histidine kinase
MNSYEIEKTEKVKKELDRLQNLIKKVDLYNGSFEDIENFNESIHYMINTLKPLILTHHYKRDLIAVKGGYRKVSKEATND